ncbi:hypothetical protein E0Z10_g6414 [Xylaria hypoxylon]|uniref:Nephrocystin 3-like N-terminal domain-containing protein n=1 Tax=Xylaria hypoxylon TaxID=37992 RepID=A0A4Z0YTC4_9PEZI|nr:hypothetical protein E0Z10_g6414 [Xylaria hypoxylon]
MADPAASDSWDGGCFGGQKPDDTNPDGQNPDGQDPDAQIPEELNPEELNPEGPKDEDPEDQPPEDQTAGNQGPEGPGGQKIVDQDPDTQNTDTQNSDPNDPDSQPPNFQAPDPPSSSPASFQTSSFGTSVLGTSISGSSIPGIPIPGLSIPGISIPSTTDSGSTMSSSVNFNPQPTPRAPTREDRRQQRREAKERERVANERERERKETESLRVQDEAIERLREQLKLGRLAICVGSGVTLYSASSQAQRLSWWGLMSNALDYFEDQAAGYITQPINQADLASARKILRKNDPTEADREDVTNRIQKLLATRIDLETSWMRAQFQNLYKDYVDQLDLLDSIKSLHQQGAMLLTTNYDDLLEKHCDLEPIDASDPNGLVSFRRGSRPAVFHPHGYWRNASNIVLSAEQYWRVKNDQVVQETLQHILATKTVLFVGCGGGLSDPNFGPLIHWVGEKNLGSGASHYILLRGREPNPVTQLPLIHLRCESFDDIPRFLKDLLDPSERREGTLAELPQGRERIRIHNWLAPTDQSGFLNDMLNLHGRNRFDRQVTQSQDIWAVNTPSRVRVRGEDGWGKTMFCTSVIQHTLRECRLGALKRARDSLAYFFCATYRPYMDTPDIEVHDFNVFLRAVISQLCPPDAVFASLRNLYTECTRYHPARQPTNAELQAVLIEILWQLERPPAPKMGDPVVPGETYLVIDELETLEANMRDEYSKFIKTVAGLQLEHFHLLVTAENALTLGIEPVLRRKRPLKGKGKKGKSFNKIFGLAPQPPAEKAANATNWAEVTLDWTTTGTASIEWIRDRFNNDPSLANYVHIRQDLIFQIHGSGQNLRWVYWKLNRLAEIGAAADLDDAELKEAAEAALEESDDEGDDDGSMYDAGDNDDGDYDDDGDVLPGGKRPKGQKNSSNKKIKQNP